MLSPTAATFSQVLLFIILLFAILIRLWFKILVLLFIIVLHIYIIASFFLLDLFLFSSVSLIKFTSFVPCFRLDHRARNVGFIGLAEKNVTTDGSTTANELHCDTLLVDLYPYSVPKLGMVRHDAAKFSGRKGDMCIVLNFGNINGVGVDVH